MIQTNWGRASIGAWHSSSTSYFVFPIVNVISSLSLSHASSLMNSVSCPDLTKAPSITSRKRFCWRMTSDYRSRLEEKKNVKTVKERFSVYSSTNGAEPSPRFLRQGNSFLRSEREYLGV